MLKNDIVHPEQSRRIDIFSKTPETISQAIKEKGRVEKEKKEPSRFSHREGYSKTILTYLLLAVIAYGLAQFFSAWLQNKSKTPPEKRTFSAFDVSVIKSSDTRTEKEITASTQSQTTTATTAVSPEKSSFKIRILNGNTVTGEAAKYKKTLVDLGFNVGAVANAVSQNYAKSQIYYLSAKKSAAELIQKTMTDKKFDLTEKDQKTIGANYDILIILGKE